MPLMKRKVFPLMEPSDDMNLRDLVYQIRFTKEIFCDYQDYLNRINLYRQRLWTCQMTGKSKLTYEEAMVSEKFASEKVSQFPKKLMPCVLRIIQFSMLSLTDLVSTIAEKLQKCWFEDLEVYAKRDGDVYLCKILKVLEEGTPKTIPRYEVAWLDKGKKSVGSNAVVNEEDLIRKKSPYTREFLKSFIRGSTYHSVPWVLHDKLAQKHGISTTLPKELRDIVVIKDGQIISNKKRKQIKVVLEETQAKVGKCKRIKTEKENVNLDEDQLIEEPIQYPIDDLLVRPCANDIELMERPLPSKDFKIPMECVGNALMVWDFCSSFRKFLHLSPFSLESFENSICHKNSNLILTVETHAALLRILIKDEGDYFSAMQAKNRKLKITLVTWTEYLCNFLEMTDISEQQSWITTIRRGHYGLLDTCAKLQIFRQLVDQVIETDIFREELDEHIKQQQALGSAKRNAAIEEGKKKREEKINSKVDDSHANNIEEITDSNFHVAANGNNHSRQNRIVSKIKTQVKKSSQRVEAEIDNDQSSSKELNMRMTLQQLKDDGTMGMAKKNIDQRSDYYKMESGKRVIRTNALGKDRDHKRYWWFKGDGRIFVESFDSNEWLYYSTTEELDTFMRSLNPKGIRERGLQKQLEACYSTICLDLQKKMKEVAGDEIRKEEAVVRRSSRVRAQPRESPGKAFLRYVNKWRNDAKL